MARALIVGCGCRGRMLGVSLREDGWEVRGTSRAPEGLPAIRAAGLEAAIADPDRPGTILELVGDVAIVCWLLGSATGDPPLVGAIHGPRLERLLEKLVDTPVRGLLYEAAGSVDPGHLRTGSGLVRSAAERWRIPAEIVAADPRDPGGWLEEMSAAIGRLTSR